MATVAGVSLDEACAVMGRGGTGGDAVCDGLRALGVRCVAYRPEPAARSVAKLALDDSRHWVVRWDGETWDPLLGWDPTWPEEVRELGCLRLIGTRS